MKLGGKFTEGDYQRQQTKFLIQSYGEYIQLIRPADLEDDGAGGLIRPDDPDRNLGPQKFWFYESAPVAHIARGTTYQEIINMGQRVTTPYVLLGMPDANVRKNDTFERDDFEYRVMFIHDDRSFQTIAEVERVGSGES